MTRLPRLWRGTVRADAILFADTADATHRILRAWERGAALSSHGDGFLLRFPASRWMRAEEAPGEVLVRVDGIWTSVDGRRASRPPAGGTPALHRLREGAVVAEPLSEQTLSPASLVDLSGYELVELTPLLAATTPNVVAPVAVPRPGREVLGLENGSADAARMARLIAQRNTAQDRGESWWSRLFRRSTGRSGQGPPREPAKTPIADAVRSLANRFLLTTRIASILGRQQAAYLAKLVDMLERRQFGDALRHAIPLTDEVASSLSRITLFSPRPRLDLSLSLHRTGASSIALIGNMADQLRALYRRAAEQLEREGDIEKAAFVLADLLDRSEEAVSLLERHGRLLLAAQLAEARKLAPELCVRQWLLAGDRERAVALARRHEAFEVAVRKLELTHVNLARELRLEWAHALAARGAYGAASDAIWPVEAERDRARHWLERAIARGGISGARALARKLSLVDEDRAATLQQIATILASEDVERASERKTLVDAVTEAWLAGPVVELAAAALRLGVRAMVRDAAHSGVMTGRDLDTLARRTGDLALRTDLPPAPQDFAVPWLSTPRVLTHVVEAHDVGKSVITDAAMLHGGTLALALGEAGCILLAPNGKVLARLVEPAHRLVVSDDLESALALAPRGDSWRVARLDLAARTASVWRDVRIEEFADSYDGATWFVTTGNELHAVDTTRQAFESVWYNPDVPGATNLARSPKSLALLVGNEVWRYEVPAYTLRMRTPVDVAESLYGAAPLPDGNVVETHWRAKNEVWSEVRMGCLLATIDGRVSEILPSAEWIGWIGRNADGAEIMLAHPRTKKVRVTVKMRNSFARARLQPGRLVVFDGQGRVVVVDLERGAVIRDLRI